MQIAPQHSRPPIPPGAYVMDPAPTSRHQYSPHTPRTAELNPGSSSGRSTNTPQTAQLSRGPGDNSNDGSSPEISLPPRYYSPAEAHPSSSSPSHGQDRSAIARGQTGGASTSLASSSYQPVRREQGPPIQAPPRTSSNQRSRSANLTLSTRSTDRNNPPRSGSRGAEGHAGQSRPIHARDIQPGGDGSRYADTDQTSGTDLGRDAAAQARRRGPASPDEPQRAISTREPRSPQSPSTIQSRSASHLAVTAPPARTGVEETLAVNRVQMMDPEPTLDREPERQAEAVPSLSLVGSSGVDDGGRPPPRSRQDYSSSASRRKETKFADYILGQTLGEGEFGKVKLGWKKDGSAQVAIKLIRRESLGSNPSRLPKIYREISILRGLSHPNIVRLHQMAETDKYIGIILEYASGGELFDFILNHRYLKDHAARRLFAQLVSGVGYLHKKGIVHRDLKLENLLLDRNRNIIITDFGFANTFDPRDELTDEIEFNLTNRDFVKRMDLERVQENGSRKGDLMQTSCGSPCYAAPELVVTDSLYTGRKVDVWSCGVILYAMLAGYLPFDDDPANPEGDNINLLYKYIVSTPLTFPEYVTPHARDLLRRILVPDPRKRADLFEVARHSWLSDYAHIVSHVTSSTTTVGEIANSTVTSDQQDTPLLARSASVREPTKTQTPNLSPVGGLSHAGRIDHDKPVDRSKPSRDPKRRTVQVEYVAPQSQTIRGEATPSAQSSALESPPTIGASGKSRARADAEHYDDTPRQLSATTAVTKQFSHEPPVLQPSGATRYPVLPNAPKAPAGLLSAQAMPPPTRRMKELPRAASESAGAFIYPHSSTTARPHTSGSMTPNHAGRLPSRGNSYSQPLAPTVAATNAQGRLAQPKNGKQYIISAPIPQTDPMSMEQPVGRPTTQHNNTPSSIEAQREAARGHKRSNTFGNVFGRSGSFFGGKATARPPPEPFRPTQEKRYPPTSMKNPIGPDSPRQSIESRRSSSFGFGRKNSDLRKNGELSKPEKPRRFSILPASFSLKSLTGTSKDSSADTILPISEPRPSTAGPPVIRVREQAPPKTITTSRNASQFDNSPYPNSTSSEIESQKERDGGSMAPSGRRMQARSQPTPPVPSSSYGGPPYQAPPDDRFPSAPRMLQPGQSYLLGESGTPTGSEASIGMAHRPIYPPGFSSLADEGRPSTQPNRGGRVLQKHHRRFADAYEQEAEPGQGTGGSHAGSSGAAKRVMDFFRRRGKARAGDDRV